MNSKNKLIYELNDKPPFFISLFLAVQHIILFLPGTVVLPLILASAIGLSPAEKERIVFVSVIISGLGSFIQVYKFRRIGSGHVLFMGSDGSFLGANISAGLIGGLGLVSAMTILAAPFEILMSYFMRYVRKIITPVMGGIVMVLISISLLPLLMEMWTGAPDALDYCSSERLITGFVTILVIIFFSFFGKESLQIWSPIIGLSVGFIFAMRFGMTNFSALQEHAWIGIPTTGWRLPDFHLQLSHLPLFISFVFATLSSTIETVGDTISVQDTSVNKLPKVNYETVQGSLYADGVSNIFSGILGTVANTTYSGNIAVLKMTGVASRKIGIFASIIIIIMAFFPKFIFFLTLIPGPVLGASSIVFMSLLFTTGIKLISSSEIDYETGLIVGISLTVGVISTFKLFFPASVPDSIKPLVENGVTSGGLTAIILTIMTKLKIVKKLSEHFAYNLDEFPQLLKTLSEVNTTFAITAKQYYHLQLCCEEIFGYICNENPDQKGTIHFTFSMIGDNLQVVVEDKSELKDIDLIDKENIDPRTDDLGLIILNKYAKEIEHVIIDGYNGISFLI